MLPHEMLQSQTQVERSLLSRVLGWLGLSLALTAGGYYLYTAGFMVGVSPFIFFIVAIALIFGIVVSLATLIFPFPISQLALSLFLGVVFVGLTFYDFWRVKSQRAGDNNALLLALSLYLDFINLFLILLRIFGRRN